jgi:hypothetical protein
LVKLGGSPCSLGTRSSAVLLEQAHTPFVLNERLESDRAAALIEALRVFDGLWHQPALTVWPTPKLGPVPLRPSLRAKHAIGEVSQVNSIGLASGHRLLQKKEASSLERHVVVGVLRE